MDCIFGVDVGGTNIKYGKFINGELVESYSSKTLSCKSDPIFSIVNQLEREIKAHIGDDNLIGIGIGVPGPVVDGVVLGGQNIYWEEVELRKILQTRFENVTIEILNDANAATLGEWYYGCGNKVPNMVLMTLGTGIGGGIIINSKLFIGSSGSAGEIGHIKIFPFNGRECNCGLSGCLEQYASATGIVKTAYGMIRNGDTVLNNRRINTKEIVDAAKENDKIALEILDKTAYYLAIGIIDIVNTLNPNTVVLGGGVSKAGDILLNLVKKHFNDLSFYSVRHNTEICLATLLNDAGIYGAFYQVSEVLKNGN